jgi:hypothetical protein
MVMSEKSVAQKLGLKEGKTILLLNPPKPGTKLLGKMPRGASIAEAEDGPFPLILAFVSNRAVMVKMLELCKPKLADGGALWLAYAKGTSPVAADINRDSIREYVESIGLTTVAAISIDDDWSALRLKAT